MRTGTPAQTALVLTGRQIRQLADLLDSDDDQVSLGFGNDLNGKGAPGLYAWATEHPEEGATALFDRAAEIAGVIEPDETLRPTRAAWPY
jgi:hypothetical protein